MDRFEEMRVFAAVVDAGSFVGASDALPMSKAAVSRHVADLEARLGVRLLHRTTRKLSLTAEGEVFHARCKEVLSTVDEAEAEITSRSGEASGLLRINAPFTFGLLHLAPLWVEFMAMHPKVSLQDSAVLHRRFVLLCNAEGTAKAWLARSAPLLEEAASQWWTDSLVFVVTLNRGMLTARMAGQPLQVTQLRLVGALFAQLAAKAKEVSSLAPTTRQE